MTTPINRVSPAEELCRILEWDSDFFGFPVARILAENPTDEELVRAQEWCRAQRVACAYLLLDGRDPQPPQRAEAAGFRFVDIRATYGLDLRKGPPPSLSVKAAALPCRPHRPEDVPHLVAIARAGHGDTRFYADGRFPKELCDRLYEVWIRRSCEDGFADIVWVADVEGVPSGYVTCRMDGQDGHIGIVGVAEAARGRGAATAMIRRALEWFRAQGAQRVSVVTQGRNLPAQRLYQRCGFTISNLQLWFHKWF